MLDLLGQAGQAAFYGLFVGALYALVAIGIVLIFRSTRTVNFAHGQFAVTGAFVFLQLSVLGRAPVWLGMTLALAAVAIMGLSWGAVAIAMERRSDDLVPLIGSLGLFIALDGMAVRIWGPNGPYRMPSLLPGFNLHLFGLAIESAYVWAVVALGLAGGALHVFFQRTGLGLQLRAAVQNREAAELLGVPTVRLSLLAWTTGSLLALVALLIYLPQSYLDDNAMTTILLSAFAASALGGFESFQGAVLGAVILGVVETLAGRFIAAAWQPLVALMLIGVLLTLNPRGVFVVRGERS